MIMSTSTAHNVSGAVLRSTSVNRSTSIQSNVSSPSLNAQQQGNSPALSPGSGRTANNRRSSSSSRSSQPNKQASYHPPDRPLHVSQDSLFSTSSGYTNYRGFLNLAVLLLVLSNARVAIENVIKYGVLVSPLEWLGAFVQDPHDQPNLLLVVVLNAFILCSLKLELLLSEQRLTNTQGGVLHAIVISTLLVLPPATVFCLSPHPVGYIHYYSCSLYWVTNLVKPLICKEYAIALMCLPTYRLQQVPTVFCMMMYVCAALKLISYAHVNYWCRAALHSPQSAKSAAVHGKSKMVVYPANLTVSNMYYYMFAPTLCYELNFPRSPKIRWYFVTKRAVELIALVCFILAATQQWIQPLIQNSIEPLVNMELGRMIERLLKLAVPNHLLWLLGFYATFHSWLNLQAEILTFADREFYRDWWNSETLAYFWSNWNMPVHRWALRHVYKPMVRHGYSSLIGSICVFLISAALHEYLISVPLMMFRLWAFLGMLAQIPLSWFTKSVLRGGKQGNVCVWLSVILGQPLCILMYFHDWYVLNRMYVQPD